MRRESGTLGCRLLRLPTEPGPFRLSTSLPPTAPSQLLRFWCVPHVRGCDVNNKHMLFIMRMLFFSVRGGARQFSKSKSGFKIRRPQGRGVQVPLRAPANNRFICKMASREWRPFLSGACLGACCVRQCLPAAPWSLSVNSDGLSPFHPSTCFHFSANPSSRTESRSGFPAYIQLFQLSTRCWA